MLLRQLHYFIAVVEHNSFTLAAESCFISQSAISQQIQALEKDLGVNLLSRRKRGFSLTPAGEYFYRQGKVLTEEIADIRRETIRLGQDGELRLKIGYPRSYSGSELHKAIADFSQTYPEISIDILNGTHEELYDLLRSGEADLILNDQRRAFSDKYVNFQLQKCGIYAEISALNPLCRKKSASLDDLKHIPCILISPKSRQSTERDYFKNTLGFKGQFLFSESLEEGRLMVAANRGFLPIEKIGTLPAPNQSVLRLPVTQSGSQMQRNYCLFWDKAKTNYYIEEFAALLKKMLADDS